MNAGIEANVLCKPRKNWPNLPLLTKMRTTDYSAFSRCVFSACRSLALIATLEQI
jgi:hypothetical protein